MKPRQEIDILQNILEIIREKPRRNRSIVVSTHLNDEMWRKYRKRMVELGLIREVEVEIGNKVFDITARGDELLKIIGVYKSVWHSFPPKSGWDRKIFKPYQEAVLEYVWEKGETGFTIREAWKWTKKVDRVARSSVSLFLNRLSEIGVLENNPRNGQGGIYGFFTLSISKVDFDSFLEDVYSRILKFDGK